MMFCLCTVGDKNVALPVKWLRFITLDHPPPQSVFLLLFYNWYFLEVAQKYLDWIYPVQNNNKKITFFLLTALSL